MENEKISSTKVRFILVPQTTPLPDGKKKKTNSVSSTKNYHQNKSSAEQIRAINEDDDGYDPYSDYKEKPQLFEKDPWQ